MKIVDFAEMITFMGNVLHRVVPVVVPTQKQTFK